MAQQTAVEWLIDKISIYIHDEVRSNPLIEQAKQMEKEQIENAFKNAILPVVFGSWEAEDYYNETYNK